MKQRRSDHIEGVVNFPVHSKKYRNSNEGGMFVRLVVFADEDDIVCCGGTNHALYDAVKTAYPGKRIRLQTWLDT